MNWGGRATSRKYGGLSAIEKPMDLADAGTLLASTSCLQQPP